MKSNKKQIVGITPWFALDRSVLNYRFSLLFYKECIWEDAIPLKSCRLLGIIIYIVHSENLNLSWFMAICWLHCCVYRCYSFSNDTCQLCQTVCVILAIWVFAFVSCLCVLFKDFSSSALVILSDFGDVFLLCVLFKDFSSNVFVTLLGLGCHSC